MQQYIGTKIIQAEPALRYSKPNVPGEDGYKVVYPDGYESWSPKAVFEEAYRPCNAMTFGLALDALKLGKKVRRAGWNGKGMWLSLSCDGTREVQAGNFWSPHNAQFARENGGKATVLPCITMKTATGEILMGWLASQSDMLSEDWEIVE